MFNIYYDKSTSIYVTFCCRSDKTLDIGYKVKFNDAKVGIFYRKYLQPLCEHSIFNRFKSIDKILEISILDHHTLRKEYIEKDYTLICTVKSYDEFKSKYPERLI